MVFQSELQILKSGTVGPSDTTDPTPILADQYVGDKWYLIFRRTSKGGVPIVPEDNQRENKPKSRASTFRRMRRHRAVL